MITDFMLSYPGCRGNSCVSTQKRRWHAVYLKGERLSRITSTFLDLLSRQDESGLVTGSSPAAPQFLVTGFLQGFCLIETQEVSEQPPVRQRMPGTGSVKKSPEFRRKSGQRWGYPPSSGPYTTRRRCPNRPRGRKPS